MSNERYVLLSSVSGTSTEPQDRRVHYSRCLIRIVVLPEAENPPSCGFELSIGVKITPPVALDLLSPPGCVVSWPLDMLGTAVPEAAVHKDGERQAREDYIRSSTRAAKRSAVDVVAQPPAVELRSEQDFRPCISKRLTSHTAADHSVSSGRLTPKSGHKEQIMTCPPGSSSVEDEGHAAPVLPRSTRRSARRP